jgi:hypothetical protein
VIASSRPGGAVGAVQQRLDLLGRQVGDGSLVAALGWDREDALDQGGVLGVAQRAVLKERAHRREADVARARAVATVVLEVLQERADRRRVQVREFKARGRDPGPLMDEAQ